MTTTPTTNRVRLRNKATGKFFFGGYWESNFSEAEVFDKESDETLLTFIRHNWENFEEVPEIDDSKKPVKVSDHKGNKTWKYKGHRISTTRVTSKQIGSYTSTRIDGEIVNANGIRAAKKLIDSGKIK